MSTTQGIDSARVNRILVIKLRAIGDVLLSTVVLSNLRAAFPAAQIDFLAESPSRGILEGNPCLNNLIIFNGKKESGYSLIRRVRAGKYDLVIDLFGNPRSAVAALLSGARYRLGFRLGWREYCYNIVAEPRGGEVHNTEFNLDALRRINVPILSTVVNVPVDTTAERQAEEFFAAEGLNGKMVVALNPGGGWYTKRWLVSAYAELGDALRREYGVEILLTWGPGEESVIDAIAKLMKEPSHRIPLVGLKALAAMLSRCTLMVTNDSGPMHIAAAMGTPIVAIFGPTRPLLQGPFTEKRVIVQNTNIDCLGCNLTECPIGNPCMENLSADSVLAATRTLIKSLIPSPSMSPKQ